MPGPFPGMDPWLEARHLWKGFHDAMIVKTVESLQPGLREAGYYIDIGERAWISADERNIWPDHLIFRKTDSGRSRESAATGVADEPVAIARFEVELREIFAEIHTQGSHELVTVIEFISPSNKATGRGRELYRQKQDEQRESGVHLVEIDLLRDGDQVFDVPKAVLFNVKPWDYLVNLVRRGGPSYEVYPILLRNSLPRIRVPLKAGDDDAVLDLQRVVDACYDIGPYPEKVNYELSPVPPLGPEDAEWADGILKKCGLRKGASTI